MKDVSNNGGKKYEILHQLLKKGKGPKTVGCYGRGRKGMFVLSNKQKEILFRKERVKEGKKG